MADISQVKEITSRLEQGVKDLFASDTYADYLKTMSRFHQYSTRNTLLIHMQMPGASHVCGFRGWQDKFGRHVVKGAKAIKILAPTPFTIREEKERLDPETRLPILDENGMPIVDQTEQRFARFKVTSVFDISQTDGKPLPSLVQDLTGDVEQYAAFLDALRAVSPLPIIFEPLPPDTDGICTFGDKISIREGMSEIQTVSAIIHEISHAKLHDLTVTVDNDESIKPKDRRTEEVEAESIAYSVSQFFNIETGANSFGYVLEWSKNRELKELNASLDTIRKTAAELIDAIDRKFQEIVKDRDITLAIGQAQTALAEPDIESEQTADTPTDRPTPGTVYARYCNQVSDIVGRDKAYINAFMNSDEQNARNECDNAVKRAVMGLFSESGEKHIELYRQYTENPDFKERLEDYVFMRNYLEPKTAQRNATETAALQEPPATEPEISASESTALPVYFTVPLETRPIGTNVLMTPVFDDMNFNRSGKKIRVTVEEPIGKYSIYIREEQGDKNLYFLTASGRIDRMAEYFYNEWDEQQRKWVNIRPTEAEFDDAMAQVAERFERDMADPAKWAKYQHAAVLNRLDECEAHNAPVRKLRDEEDKRAREEQARQDAQERLEKQGKYDARVDEIAKAIEKGETISVGYDKDAFDGKNPVLDLFRLYGVDLPLRTQGWVNTGLAELSESGYRYYSSKHKRNSTTFSEHFAKLREAIRALPIEQKRAELNPTQPDPAAEAEKFIQDIGGIGNLFGKPTPHGGDIRPQKERRDTLEYQLYLKFAELFPQVASGEYRYLRLEAGGGMEPLSLEWIGNDKISVMHTYKLNGDLCYNPMIVFEVGYGENDVRMLTPVEYEQSIPPVYQVKDSDSCWRSVDGNGNEKTVWGLQKSINEFSSGWFDNIAQQGYLPVKANMVIDGEETQITFDADGKAIMPESSESFEVTVFTYEDGGYDTPAGEFDNRQDAEAYARLLENGGYYGVGLRAVIDGAEHSLTVSMSLDDAQNNSIAVERFAKFAEGLDPSRESAPPAPVTPIDAVNTASKAATLDLSIPDPLMTAAERDAYGYTQDDMFPLSRERAVELFDTEHTIYLLYPDNTEAMAFDRDEIQSFDGLCGIERGDWERSPVLAAQKAAVVSAEAGRESDLLHGSGDRFGIYQVKNGEDARDYRFEPMDRLTARGLAVDRKNYELVYTMPFSDEIEPLTDKNNFLNQIYETFNIAHPEGYTGRSVSVSDVIVIKYNGGISSHYVDDIGFAELPAFLGEEKAIPPQVIALPAQSYSQLGNTQREDRTAPPAPPRARLSLMERLEVNKQKAARQGQPDAHKTNEREV